MDNKVNDLIGRSQNILNIKRLIKQAAQFELPVLISGESGTGKEIVSRLIHQKSQKKNFVPLNCGALPKELVESELFGYKKGAFTGAFANQKGKINEADGGTLFLDEIGELNFAFQPKFLRVIQEKQVSPIGSNKFVESNFRLISATNKNIEKLVEAGDFRKDLFYRINGLQIKIKPLRERKEDIALLLDYFLEIYNKKFNKNIKAFNKKIKEKLSRYSWPGNVRELQSYVEKEVFFAEKEEFISHIPDYILNKKKQGLKKSFNLKENERKLILDCIKCFDYNINLSAKKLGISRATLYRKIKEHEINY
ncbi:MAG: sigma-54 interaction domain-containing protein [Candidatus Muiribacteriota bacterium]